MTTTTEVSTPATTSSADAGLLILRLGLGATMLQAGLMKALDFNSAVGFMESGAGDCAATPLTPGSSAAPGSTPAWL
jgi:uncharacterized membrane protein YphA (DoxX/SURF4 family)